LRVVEEAEPQTLSMDELRLAIESFGEADWIRLNKIAKILANGRQITWEDLLQEAICRALSAVRRCPRDVAPTVFLGNAMRSIASASDKERPHDPLQIAESIHANDEGDEPHPVMEIEDPKGSPEDFAIAREALEEIDVLFANDEAAQLVIMGRIDGLSPEEIQEVAGLDRTGYATVLRRIRRHIEKHESTGGR
jgi:DNA-directed RNA polymerase specialized sigma24 family protein